MRDKFIEDFFDTWGIKIFEDQDGLPVKRYKSLDEIIDETLDKTKWRKNMPSINVSKIGEKNMFIEVQATGFTKDEISVELKAEDNSYITYIVGTPEQPQNDMNEVYAIKQFEKKPFETKVLIPKEAYDGEVDVTLENGILTISFILAEPINKTKKVF